MRDKLGIALPSIGTVIAALMLYGCAPASKPAVPTPAPTMPSLPHSTAPAGKTTLQWLGHSTFLLTSSQGTRVLLDPMPLNMGYNVAPIPGVDAITVGHEHSDHNNVGLASGSPTVIRGLVGGDWAKIEQRVKDIAIRNLPTFHDEKEGKERGKNSVFLFEVDGLRLVHLSDLGHLLSAEQVRALKPVDVLMIPVGGFYTIDATQASQVVEQLSPKIVLPMHYKTPRLRADWPGSGVEPFLSGKKVERPDTNTLSLSPATLPQATTVVVLNYE